MLKPTALGINWLLSAICNLIWERLETVEVSLYIAEHPCGQTAISSLFHGNSLHTGAGKIKWSVYENGMIVYFVPVHVNLIAKIQD